MMRVGPIQASHLQTVITRKLQEIELHIKDRFKTRFVVQEHWATHHHFDLRIQKDDVLVSWALPKAVIPEEDGKSILAVQTPDHPLYWYDFEGTIPEGEYGAGKVKIFDKGECIVYKWTKSIIVVLFKGRKVKGFYSLVHTSNSNWLLMRMKQEKAAAKYI